MHLILFNQLLIICSKFLTTLEKTLSFKFFQSLVESHLQHNPRYCTCPCHFLPVGRRSLGIQASPALPVRVPRHYRLMTIPSTKGLEGIPWSAKSLTLATRAILSQVRLE